MTFDPQNMAPIKARLANWWQGGPMDRPLFFMKTEGDIPPPEAYFPNVESRWLDIDKRLDYEELRMANTRYHAEAYPFVSGDLGPGSLALLLGSHPGYAWDTVWYHPCFDDIANAHVTADPRQKFWAWTLEFSRRAVQRAAGRYVVEMPDLIENYDTLCSLLGTEELLYSMVDDPAEVHRLQGEVLACWKAAYDQIYGVVRGEDDGSGWGGFNAWAPGRMAKIQCDISLTVSRDMFAEFALPYFREQAKMVDYALYHLDGPGALQHADTVLSIPELKVIQWQPGAGAPEAIDPVWFDLQKRILASGRRIMIFMKPADPDTLIDRLERFIRTVGKQGVFIVLEWSLPSELCNRILEASYTW